MAYLYGSENHKKGENEFSPENCLLFGTKMLRERREVTLTRAWKK